MSQISPNQIIHVEKAPWFACAWLSTRACTAQPHDNDDPTVHVFGSIDTIICSDSRLAIAIQYDH